MSDIRVEPFENHANRYDDWFEKHDDLYRWELEAVRSLMVPLSKSVEIGVGTGRFAKPLGIEMGIEPSERMAAIARKRGINTMKGRAERLPLEDKSVDLILMVTTICFVSDPVASAKEAYRVLSDGGYMLVAFVDKESELGRKYDKNRSGSDFYRDATFYSTDEVISIMTEAGFTNCTAVQTLFGSDLEHMIGGVLPGYGQGAFVVVRCAKRVEEHAS